MEREGVPVGLTKTDVEVKTGCLHDWCDYGYWNFSTKLAKEVCRYRIHLIVDFS